MRPIKLTIIAFGPYAATQVIDFRDLKDRTFFLIHGRTGGGKTSLLDAMCYALYGDSSGDEREGKDMRSHHADPTLRTEVTFDFSIGKETYRATRSPQQERPRKKGGGVTVEPAQATLWRRTGVSDDEQEGVVLAGQPGKVSDEVERLLGFQSDQFRQVVILPQGKFRQLLMAESADREKILETLFKTELYKRIEHCLKEAAREIKTRWNDATMRSQVILQHANAATINELQEQKEVCQTNLKEAEATVAQARVKHESARHRLNEGLKALDKLKELAHSEAALNLLQQQENIYKDKADRLKAAQAAARIAPTEEVLKQRTAEFSESQKKVEIAGETFAKVTTLRDKAEETLRSEEGRETVREELKREAQRLEELTAKLDELRKVIADFQAAEKGVLGLEQEKSALTREAEGCESLHEEKQQLLRETESIANSLEANRQVALNAEKVLNNRKILETACDELKDSIVQAEKVRTSLEKACSELETARKRQASLESSWFAGQAAILAERLVDGEPCPVCGSPEHPRAASSEHALPTEEELKSSREQVTELEKLKDESFKRYSERQIVLTRLQSQVHTLTDALGEAALEDITVLQHRARESKALVSVSEDAASRMKSLAFELTALKEKLAALKLQQEVLEAKLKTENENRMQLAGIVKERESSLPAEFREAQALEIRCRQVKSELSAMELALKEAQTAVTSSNQRLAVCEVELRNATEIANQSELWLKNARDEFAAQLKSAQFMTEDDYRSSSMTASDMRQLELDTQNFAASLQAALERSMRAKDSAQGVEAPEIALLEKDFQDAQAASESAVRNESTLSVKLQQIDQLLSELEKMQHETQTLEREFETIGRISEVANGGNGRKLTFQRFVLGALLDDVLLAASERLSIMSQGRYRLQRLSGVSDLRKAGGLELEVFDSYTGTTRGVATLSGGESFLASLSLALGLADVVQSYAGGIHLDTMFIDEGFGSLDPESLDFAIRALSDLQKSGRLVGIISHVPELRERIDARLEVLPSGQGSMVRICVG